MDDTRDQGEGQPPQIVQEEFDLRQGIEMLFFAYREFTGEADQILEDYGFGRAHHRVIYFVGRHPDINVSELLDILRITKQSLSRVLSQLIREKFIIQENDAVDRRRKLLRLSEKGRKLEQQLTAQQSRLLGETFLNTGHEAVRGFEQVLRGIINESDYKWMTQASKNRTRD